MILFLLVNSMCDLCCSYCFYTIGHEKRDSSYIDGQKAEVFANAINRIGFKSVILTGGDPLYSGLKEHSYVLIEELKKRGIRVLINTSGAKLEDADYDCLVQLGVDRIDISINSYDEAIHNSERGYYQDAVRLIDEMHKRGYRKLATTTVITPTNSSLAASTLSWLLDKGVEDVRFQPVFIAKELQDYSTIGCTMNACMKIASKPHTERYVRLCEEAFTDPNCKVDDCRMGKSYFVCNAKGDLHPCFHVDEKLCNILSDDLDFIRMQIRKSSDSKRGACFGKHCVSLFDNPIFWKE